MEVRYRNDLYGSYMLITIPDTEDSNRYSFKMLEKNKIPGVLSCKERKEDGRGYWYVDVSKKKNLIQEYQEKEMWLEDIIDIFQQLIPILEDLRNYLLNESMVVLDPEYMFRDLEDKMLYVLPLPWNREENTLHKLAEFFLEKINHRDENGVNAAYLFYRQQSQQHFSIYHFLPVLEKESILKRQRERENENNRRYEPVVKGSLAIEGEEIEVKYPVSGDLESEENDKESKKAKNRKGTAFVLILSLAFLTVSFLPMINSLIQMSCIAFSILLLIVFLILILKKEKKEKRELKVENRENIPMQKMDIGLKETVFFDSFENEDHFKLQWKERGRRKQFILKEFPCTVGKIKEETDICISDISISRIHCRFIEHDNKVCIMDLNSTNGTYLNGMRVENGEILEIEKNDEILIGKVAIVVV